MESVHPMNNSLNFACSVHSQPRLGRGLFSLSVIGAFCLTSASLFAQDPTPVAETPGGRRRNTTPGETTERAERRNLTPEDMQARMLTQMRERFEVTDDEEW